jgi:hypothetical protein
LLFQELLALVLLAFLVAVTYVREFVSIAPIFFWALWAAVICDAIFILMRAGSHKEQLLVLAIVLVGIIVTKSPLSFTPYQVNGTDDYFEMELAKTIVATGRWDPTAGTGFAANYYGYFPGVHLVLAALSSVLGMDVFLVGKFVYLPILTVLLFSLAFRLLRLCCRGVADEYFVGIAMLLYIFMLGILSVHISRKTYGDVFLMTILFMLAKQLVEGRKIGNTAVLFLAAIGLAIGDHFPQYYLVAIILGLILFMVRNKLPIGPTLRQLSIVFALAFSWELFIAQSVLAYDWRGYITSTLRFILSGGEGGGSSVALGVGYNSIERLFPYLAQAILVVLAAIGLIVGMRNRNFRPEIARTPSFVVMKFTATFGLIVYVLTAPLVLTSFFFFVYTTSLFTTIGVSALFCIGLLSIFKAASRRETGSSSVVAPSWSISRTLVSNLGTIRRKALVLIVLFLVVSSGNMIFVLSARFLDRGPSSIAAVEDWRNIKPEVLESGVWLQSHLTRNPQPPNIFGDYPVWVVFAGYLSLGTIYYDATPFTSEQAFQEYGREYNVAVVDANLATLPSYDYPGDFPSPVIYRLNSVGVNQIYSNGLIFILTFTPG